MGQLYWDKLLFPKRQREKSTEGITAGDERSPFKKDFDTVCNSSVLRRLQDKAQVFPLEKEDYARTRLTHSIEVMSIAESLAMQSKNKILESLDEYVTFDVNDEGYNDKLSRLRSVVVNDLPIILKTASLLHDMGNPPFGHLGEQIIGDWFKENLKHYVNVRGKYQKVENADGNNLSYFMGDEKEKDLMFFEGNAQLLRLVSKLCFATDEYGMNLSYPVLASFIKYPCASNKVNKKNLILKKPGYFQAEKELFDDIENTLGLEKCRHPLAYLLEAADDIAYLSADIEDAQRKGLISIDDLLEYLKRNDSDELVKKIIEKIEDYRNTAISLEYPDVDSYISHRLRVAIKGNMIGAVIKSFEENYDTIMKGEFDTELIKKSTAAKLSDVLRQVEVEKIYYCNEILENKTRAFTIIKKLLDTYVPAILNLEKDEIGKDTENNLLYQSLSTNYRYVCEKAITKAEEECKKEKNQNKLEGLVAYYKLLLVTDQISGMTDTHAMTIYNMITAGPNIL